MFSIQSSTRRKFLLLLTFETVSDYIWMTMKGLNSILYFTLFVIEINNEMKNLEVFAVRR